MIGDDYLVISGFSMSYKLATAKNYALRMRDPAAQWRAMDDLPVTAGITHGAFAVVGLKLYMCGGYLGGHPVRNIIVASNPNTRMIISNMYRILPTITITTNRVRTLTHASFTIIPSLQAVAANGASSRRSRNRVRAVVWSMTRTGTP
jgi:hypothetical protein